MPNPSTFEEHLEDVIVRMKNIYGVGSDRQLGDALGVSHNSVSVMRSRCRLPMDWIYQIAIKHKVSIDWLLFGPEAKKLKDGAALEKDPIVREDVEEES